MQEASWGGAGVKILLSVKYQREPQGDEPSTEPRTPVKMRNA